MRTEGIYTIMITLAIGVAFHYLALQNYSVFNGFQGLQRVYPPNVLGIDWRSPVPFYFLCAVLRAGGLLRSSSTWSARRSASRCRAFATTRAA